MTNLPPGRYAYHKGELKRLGDPEKIIGFRGMHSMEPGTIADFSSESLMKGQYGDRVFASRNETVAGEYAGYGVRPKMTDESHVYVLSSTPDRSLEMGVYAEPFLYDDGYDKIGKIFPVTEHYSGQAEVVFADPETNPIKIEAIYNVELIPDDPNNNARAVRFFPSYPTEWDVTINEGVRLMNQSYDPPPMNSGLNYEDEDHDHWDAKKFKDAMAEYKNDLDQYRERDTSSMDLVRDAVDDYKQQEDQDRMFNQDVGLDRSLEYQGMPKAPSYAPKRGRGQVGR